MRITGLQTIIMCATRITYVTPTAAAAALVAGELRAVRACDGGEVGRGVEGDINNKKVVRSTNTFT